MNQAVSRKAPNLNTMGSFNGSPRQLKLPGKYRVTEQVKDFIPASTPRKSPEELARLDQACQNNTTLAGLPPASRRALYDAMTLRGVLAGEVVIQQGTPCDCFYVLEQGVFDVICQQPYGQLKRVHTYAEGERGNAFFGEQAVVLDGRLQPAGASVVARTDGILWTLETRLFQALMMRMQKSASAKLEVLRSVSLLQPLTQAQLHALAEALQQDEFAGGECLVQQGDDGDEFFIIDEGEVVCTVQSEMDARLPPQQVLRLEAGQYFGERGLLASARRAANVVALGPVKVWRLTRSAFEEVLGPLQHILDQQGGMKRALSTPNLANSFSVNALAGSASQPNLMANFQGSFNGNRMPYTNGDPGRNFNGLPDPGFPPSPGSNPSFSGSIRPGSPGLQPGLQQQSFTMTHPLPHPNQSFNDGMSCSPGLALSGGPGGWTAVNPLARLSGGAGRGGDLTLDKLMQRGCLFTTGDTALVLMERVKRGDMYTVRLTSIAAAVAQGRQQQVLRAADITRSLLPLAFVPGVTTCLRDSRVLAEVLTTQGLCALGELMFPQPFNEPTVAQLAGSVVLGLESLHSQGIVFRALTADTLVVTQDGDIMLADFRWAKRMLGNTRTYTLCGCPPYMAPELLEPNGHTHAVDFWALGVLIYFLLTGHYPFANPGEAAHAQPMFPPHLSSELVDLVQRLLRRDPARRLGVQGTGPLKAHPWLKGLKWDALQRQQLAPPQALLQRMQHYERMDLAPFSPQPYMGDSSWLAAF
ncbi:hypothetical protein WJX72_001383 [[Myrmecia] bisecta]|uniref:cGMP-dependent protein kinase n=1 Tax=[Myrmecia] bisecta TaxID=41462 RepID=A0AAW1R4H4_9CHLO